MNEGYHVFFVVMGAVGLWLIVNTLFGSFDKLFKKFSRDKLGAMEGLRDGRDNIVTDESSWPLSARIAKSLTSVPGLKMTESNRDLMTKLFQAGLPFYTPAHYFTSQILITLLFGGGALLALIFISTIIQLPAIAIMFLSLAGAMFGATLPSSELKNKIKKRKEDLIVDMTYQLPRLISLLAAYGTILEAIKNYGDRSKSDQLTEKQKKTLLMRSQELTKQYAMELNIAIRGMGGNIFSEMLGRLASDISGGKSPEEAVTHIQQLYPFSIEVNNFLEIFTSGLKEGYPTRARLQELADQLRFDMKQRAKDAASRANLVVIVAGFMALLPMMIIIGAPMIDIAIDLFG